MSTTITRPAHDARRASAAGHGEEQEDPDVARRRSRRVRIARILLRVCLMIAVFVAIIAALPELRSAMAVLPDANPWWLGAALLAQIASVASVPQVYRRALRQMRVPMAYREAWRMALGAFALSRLLPAGGAAGGIYAARHLNHRDVTWPRASASIALAAFSTMVTLGVIVALGAFVAASQGVTSMLLGEIVVAVVGVAMALVAFLPGVLRSPSARSRIVNVAHRVAPRRVDRVQLQIDLGEAASHIPGPRAVGRVMPWAAVQWSFELLALWFVFHALGNPLPLAVLILGIGAANLLIALPSTPGGIGVVEAGTSGALVALGVTAPIAIAGVLIARIGSYWLPVGFGLLALTLNRR